MLFLYKTARGEFHRRAVDLLEDSGIETHTKKLEGSSLRPFFRSVEYDIYVCNDQDFDRAKQLLIGIGADNPPPVQLPDHFTTTLMIVGALACLMVGLYFFDGDFH
ncbi:MAG TPA: hypothetical protein VH082_06405 [Rudaea sp.]|jgi:hypothetical protein|nr:hypothetical protein [Rudaea sp.]